MLPVRDTIRVIGTCYSSYHSILYSIFLGGTASLFRDYFSYAHSIVQGSPLLCPRVLYHKLILSTSSPANTRMLGDFAGKIKRRRPNAQA